MQPVPDEVREAESRRVTHLKLPPRNERTSNTEVLGDAEIGGEFSMEGVDLIIEAASPIQERLRVH